MFVLLGFSLLTAREWGSGGLGSSPVGPTHWVMGAGHPRKATDTDAELLCAMPWEVRIYYTRFEEEVIRM